MKYLMIAAYIIIYVFFGTELGYTTTSPWWTHITYMFQHASWIHLILNSVALYFALKAIKVRIKDWWSIPVAFTAAVAVTFAARYSIPTVGASGFIYALWGVHTGWSLHKSTGFSLQSAAFVCTSVLIAIAAGELIGSCNTALHLYSFVVALLITAGIKSAPRVIPYATKLIHRPAHGCDL
jgi:membrane associated rhomboid family serine protease